MIALFCWSFPVITFHCIPTRPNTEQRSKPRPIIAKVSYFKDNEFVKAHIKIPRKGARIGVADDFPKELDEARKEEQQVFKKARQERKLAFFNVEKLIIDSKIYNGPETKRFPFYGQLMESG